MGAFSRLVAGLIGERIELPGDLLVRYPELAEATYRRGGLPVRIGGWALGVSSAAAITLWKTIFIAPTVRLDAELLLHELRHVHQFSEHKAFPVSYLWQSIRYGYSRNAYEVDARRYSASRLNTVDKGL
ncbi:MAG TPA: hypothetical protein VFP77_11395 [Gemmatimonadaceae bacterium]|jgi:hypothetical protein|nr:hypothetical protein [Gemmatimonadaceae bacterium]